MVLRWRQLWHVLKGTVMGAVEDKAPRLGAALAYYSVLALAPLIILVTPVADALFGPHADRAVAGQVAQLVGPEGTQAVRDVLSQITYPFKAGVAARTLSILVLLFGASGVFAELQDALDTIWEVAPKPGRAAIFGYIRQRFISFAMVLGTGFLLVVSLLFSAALAAVQRYADARVQGLVWLWSVLGTLVSFGVTSVLFASIFKILPDVDVPWRGVTLGAVITSALFSIGRYLIGTYLGKASIGSAYGAAGSIVVLLIWIYYSAQILYLGAEFTKVYTRRTRTPAPPSEIAVPITEEARAQQGIAHQEVVQAVKEVVERKADEAGQTDAAETKPPPQV